MIARNEHTELELADTLSRAEAGTELGVDPRTVDRMADDGLLARFKVGSADSRAANTKNGQDKRPVRFSKAEVSALKEARTRPTLASA